MRGASRASLAAAKDRLAELAAAADDPAGLGAELFAVVSALESQPGVRRALSDPAYPPQAKADLADALLSEKVSPAALELVTLVAASRWSAPRDAFDALESMAVLAVVIAADGAGKLDDLEDELFRFSRIVNSSPDLRVALSSPYLAAEHKQELLGALLNRKVARQTMQLIVQASVHPRGRSLDATLEEYARIAAQQRDRLVAEVHAAVPLTARQRGRLAAALTATYGRDVHLNIVLDPAVVGGMSVQVGDELIDGAMASRLAELRRKLTA